MTRRCNADRSHNISYQQPNKASLEELVLDNETTRKQL
mgnify:FL=1